MGESRQGRKVSEQVWRSNARTSTHERRLLHVNWQRCHVDPRPWEAHALLLLHRAERVHAYGLNSVCNALGSMSRKAAYGNTPVPSRAGHWWQLQNPPPGFTLVICDGWRTLDGIHIDVHKTSNLICADRCILMSERLLFGPVKYEMHR